MEVARKIAREIDGSVMGQEAIVAIVACDALLQRYRNSAV